MICISAALSLGRLVALRGGRTRERQGPATGRGGAQDAQGPVPASAAPAAPSVSAPLAASAALVPPAHPVEGIPLSAGVAAQLTAQLAQLSPLLAQLAALVPAGAAGLAPAAPALLAPTPTVPAALPRPPTSVPAAAAAAMPPPASSDPLLPSLAPTLGAAASAAPGVSVALDAAGAAAAAAPSSLLAGLAAHALAPGLTALPAGTAAAAADRAPGGAAGPASTAALPAHAAGLGFSAQSVAALMQAMSEQAGASLGAGPARRVVADPARDAPRALVVRDSSGQLCTSYNLRDMVQAFPGLGERFAREFSRGGRLLGGVQPKDQPFQSLEALLGCLTTTFIPAASPDDPSPASHWSPAMRAEALEFSSWLEQLRGLMPAESLLSVVNKSFVAAAAEERRSGRASSILFLRDSESAEARALNAELTAAQAVSASLRAANAAVAAAPMLKRSAPAGDRDAGAASQRPRLAPAELGGAGGAALEAAGGGGGALPPGGGGGFAPRTARPDHYVPPSLQKFVGAGGAPLLTKAQANAARACQRFQLTGERCTFASCPIGRGGTAFGPGEFDEFHAPRCAICASPDHLAGAHAVGLSGDGWPAAVGRI